MEQLGDKIVNLVEEIIHKASTKVWRKSINFVKKLLF